MCGCSDGPAPAIYKCVTVTARKQRVCCECYGEILPGSNYELVSGKWQDRFETFHTCLQCVAMREFLKLECWCCGELFEELHELRDDRPEVQSWLKRYRENAEKMKQQGAL